MRGKKKKVVMEKLNGMWKDFKHNLKEQVFGVCPPDLVLAHRDKWIFQQDWKALGERARNLRGAFMKYLG